MKSEVPQPTTATLEPWGGSASAALRARSTASAHADGWLAISCAVSLIPA